MSTSPYTVSCSPWTVIAARFARCPGIERMFAFQKAYAAAGPAWGSTDTDRQ